MPYAAGVYGAPSNSWNPAVAGAAINATDWAALLADLTTALSACVLKDGTQSITANIPMGGFKLTGLATGSAAGDSTRYEQAPIGLLTAKGGLISASAANTPSVLAVGANGLSLLADSSQPTGLNWLLSGALPLGTIAGTNTITAVAAPVPAAYAVNQAWFFIPAAANTGATTINISGKGARNIFASNAALVGGELRIGIPVLIIDDGTQFQIIGPVSKQQTRQVFTIGTAATYTTPTGATRLDVQVIGGGSGGDAGQTNAGAGGNASSFAGGAVTLTANGGSAPTANSGAGGIPGAGGTATGGDINLSGSAGCPGSGGTSLSGNGAPGFMGMGAGSGSNNSSTAGGDAGRNTGAGGGGGGVLNGANGAGGSSGGYTRKLIVSPAATYTYTVGAQANGGTAGASAGGKGADGIIIVDEYYN